MNRNADGTVATYDAKYRELGMHLTGTFTREEYVPNERIVDRSSTGVVFEPDATGTTLNLGWDASRLMKMLDAVFFHGDKDIDDWMAKIKQAVEALP